MNIPVLLNDPPCGSEQSYDGLPPAKALSSSAVARFTLFLATEKALLSK